MGLLALRCVYLILLVEHSRLKLGDSTGCDNPSSKYALKLLSVSYAEL